jgi:hypothetical protein
MNQPDQQTGRPGGPGPSGVADRARGAGVVRDHRFGYKRFAIRRRPSNAASLAMGIAAAVAILCYVIIGFGFTARLSS